MVDKEKVVRGLEEISDYFYDIYRKETDQYKYLKAQEYYNAVDDAIELLKEQEHKDKMFHALEEDWKRLKELLKEQEAVKPKKGKTPEESAFDCGNCGYPLWEDELYCAHCGKAVKWND